MSQDPLVELRARRAQVEDEMRIRIDEIDRLITRISESDLPVNSQSVQATSKVVTGKRRRRRQSTTTASDIIERPILEAMMKTGSVTTKEIASILPDNGWVRLLARGYADRVLLVSFLVISLREA